MSPSPSYKHGIFNNNINRSRGYHLKNSMCLVFMENLDFKYHPDINDDYVCPDVRNCRKISAQIAQDIFSRL